MKLEFGSYTRGVAVVSLAIGLAFGSAASLAAQDDDADDGGSGTSTAYLYQGTIDDLGSATMVERIDDLDDIAGNDDDDIRSDDDVDDIDENDDARDDDDTDDGTNNNVTTDDDWDDDGSDDGYEGDDDGTDDFLGQGQIANLQNSDDDHWTVLGNGQERPAGLISAESEINNDHSLTVQSLVDGEYMVVVHAENTTDSPVIAAGNIEGTVQGGTILIELDEINGSGFEGRAFVQPEGDDDINELEVTVGVFPVGTVGEFQAPVPTPRG